jgi:alkanesulfonate monooxygenase
VADVSFISVVPRVRDLGRYCETATNVIRWSDQADLDGVLIFTGTGAVLDPWIAATATAASTARLAPLVAVNPVYQHPYTAARMVASIGLLYDRRVDLNLITGTAVSDLAALGDGIDHDERYERLAEYVEIMMGLLGSPRPVSYDGKFYRISRLQLSPALPARLLPRLFVAGQSPAAQRVAQQAGAISIQMLMPGPADAPPGAGAMHFGVVTRPSEDAAARAAHDRFPADQAGAKLVAATMGNTDSTWKRRLFEAAADSADADPGYWLAPFRSAQADCPYLVGDYASVAGRLARLAGAGVRHFVIDTPATEADFQHLAQAVRATRDRLAADPPREDR